jgi:uncharacterized membrane protein
MVNIALTGLYVFGAIFLIALVGVFDAYMNPTMSPNPYVGCQAWRVKGVNRLVHWLLVLGVKV